MEQEPPTIELAGVRLRALRLEDAVPWHGYLSDPQVTELTSYPRRPDEAAQQANEADEARHDRPKKETACPTPSQPSC
jgi:RimJ/RimL family protein N-acetyltransferase